ncbi:hypothetical protein SARC_01039, partial [Sphaeroforma arctica JP610]
RSSSQSTALLVVDLQYDFLPDGSLAVPGGDEIIPHVLRLVNGFNEKERIVVATQDWHPAGHGSFASAHGKDVFSMGTLGGIDQVMWPDHCVQESRGAELHDDLPQDKVTKILRKGIKQHMDSYSGFFDNQEHNDTGLDLYLKSANTQSVVVCGLATDFCVCYTALDARKLGYKVYLVLEACRGIDSPPGYVDKEVQKMVDAGVEIVTTQQVLALI